MSTIRTGDRTRQGLAEHDGPIEAIDLTLEFGSVTAIDGVDFVIEPGRSAALIGPNGSGKTTILRLIAGLARPDRGLIRLPRGSEVAYVSQHASTPNWLPVTAGEVVEMGRYRHRGLVGRLTDTDRAIVARAAEHLDVADLLSRTYGDLSGGQRQRVRLAQALAQEPTILLLDEPITGLDLVSQQLILDLIEDQTGSGVTVIITTHNLDEARHCDQVLLLRSRLVAAGAPSEVLTTDALRQAFGNRLLGDHRGHQHDHELLVFDDHGHDH